MPTLTNPNRGSSYSAPRYSPPKVSIGGGQDDQTVGKFQFGLEQKPGEIISAAGALTEAAVGFTAGVARSIPIFGKPITDFVGGLATGISEIGIPGGPKVKDVANVPLKLAEGAGNVALDALGFLGSAVERGVAQARVMTTNGSGFNDLPDDVKGAIMQKDYIKAGNLLYGTGKTYGTGLQALALSVLFDPLTYIPGAIVAKPFRVAGTAAKTAIKYGVGATKAEIAAKMATEAAQQVLKESVNVTIWDKLTNRAASLSRIAPDGTVSQVGREPIVANINRTLSGVEKAAAQSRYGTETLLSAQETADQLIDQIALTVNPKVSNTAREAAAIGQLREAFQIIAPDDPQLFDEIVFELRRGIDEETLVSVKKRLSRLLQERAAVGEIKARGSADILKSKIDNFSRELRVPMAKIIRDSKQDLEYLLGNPAEAERIVTAWLKDGLKITADEAKPLVDDILDVVRGGNREDALSALEFARQQGYGSYRDTLVRLRNSAGEYPEDVREAVSRLTIASTRSLDDAVEAALKAEIDAASADMIPEILRRYVLQYDELFARFGYTPLDELDAQKILKYIGDSNIKIERIPAGLLSKMPASVQEVAARLKEAGYEISLAPRDGYREIQDVVTGMDGLDTVVRLVTPWADITDDFPSRVALSTSESVSARKSALMRIFDTLVSEPSSRQIRQRSYEKFVLSGVNNGMSRGEAREVWVAISNAAQREEVTLRGLIGKSAIKRASTLDQIAKNTLGKQAYDRLARSAGYGYDDRAVFKMVLKSLNGDLSEIGLFPKISATAKDRLPEVMVVTDYAYPLFRFGMLNPFFRYILENIEPEFFRVLRGAYNEKRDLILDETRSSVIARALISERSVIREFGDAQVAMSRANLQAAGDIARRNTGFMGMLEKLFDNPAMRSVKDVSGRKRRAFEKIASRDAAQRWVKDWAAQNPRLMEELVKFYNTSDPFELAYNISLDLVLRDDPLAAVKYMDDLIGQTVATRLANAAPEVQNAFYNAAEAFKYSYFKGAKTARRSIYYEEDIPFWVRSMNHPFLAIYPLSYMVTKVIPEFAEALFLKVPFVGAERIGVGYNVYQEFSEQLVMELEYGDGGLLSFFKKNPDFAYFINMLFPGIPSQLGFSIPANVRNNIVEPGLRGEGVQWDQLVSGVGDQFFRGTVGGQLNNALRAVEDLTDIRVQLPGLDLENLSPIDAAQTKN